MEKDKIIRSARLLVVGGSAGSIEVLLKILPDVLQKKTLTIAIVLHRKNSSDSSLPDLFATRTKIPLKEIEDKEPLLPSAIYLAPADYHLLFEKNNSFSLDFSEKVNYSRPSIDVAFESASDVYGADLCCLLLSGANADGVEGLRTVKKNGGQLAVQNPDTAESPFMPQRALLKNDVDFVLNPDDMAEFINAL